MKKLLLITAFLIPFAVFGQGTQRFSKDISLVGTTPTLFLPATGGVINFNAGDVTLTHTANTLTLGGGNLIVPSILTGYSTTATAAGSTTLTVASNYLQYFTGATTQTVVLPVTSTLTLGQEFLIVNNSTGLVTINSSGGNAIIILGASTSARVTCILISGTTAASWSASYKGIGITSGKKLSVSNTLILAGTDATTMTFPSTSATIARTDAANTFTGGYALPTSSTHIWTAGGSVVLATAGTDAACSNGDRYWSEIMVPYNTTLTGVSYLIGSVGATDSVVIQLVNSAGVEVATTKTTGANHAKIVGTAANFQSIPFAVAATPTPYAAIAGLYYIVIQFNGVTAKFRTYPIPGSKFIAGTVAGTWGTKADITPGTTFTAGKGPIAITY